jgi:hypothetical protein
LKCSSSHLTSFPVVEPAARRSRAFAGRVAAGAGSQEVMRRKLWSIAETANRPA